MKFYSVKGSLKEYTTTEKDMKYKISWCPDDSLRVIDLEVQGAEFVEGLSPKHESEESKFNSTASTEDIAEDDDEEDDDDDEGLSDKGLMIAYTKTGEKVTLSDFDIKGVIGRGTFGKVFLAEHKSSKMLFAIKSLRKDILVEAG